MANKIVNPYNGGSKDSPLEVEVNLGRSIRVNNPGWIRQRTSDLFIRIAITGMSKSWSEKFEPPTIKIRVCGSGVCKGSQIELATEKSVSKTLYLDQSNQDLDHRVGKATLETLDGDAHLYRLQVAAIENHNSIQYWEIEIINTMNEPLLAVWVVADTDTDACFPWLDIPSPQDLGRIDDGENNSASLSFPMVNRGTGGLVVSGPKSKGSFDFGIPMEIVAGEWEEMAVTFRPPAGSDGTFTEEVVFAMDHAPAQSVTAANHNNTVKLSVAYSRPEIVLAPPTLTIVTD